MENAIGNAAILWAAARLFHWRLRPLRLVIAALIGAAYAVLEVYLGGLWAHPAARLLLGAGLAWLALPASGLRQLALRAGVFYAMTFLLGGGAVALAYLTGWQGAASILSALALSLLMVEQLGRTVRQRAGKRIVELKIAVQQGPCITLHALIDTGASVQEPLSGAPVLLVEQEALPLPEQLTQALAAPQADALASASFGIRLVPYRPLGQQGQIAAAFRPHQVFVDGRALHGAYIAPVADVFSPLGEYRALASPAILFGEGQ